MAKVIILGVLILLVTLGIIASFICALKAQSSKPRKFATLVALVFVCLLVIVSFFEVEAAKSYKETRAAEQEHQEQLDKAAAEAEAMESQTATEPAGEDAGGESTDETEETEPETEEPDWKSMSADYLLDKPNMNNGAIRALEMTERDMHRFDEEYGRTVSVSSTNDAMIYRIGHAKDKYAFSNSILVNFADRWYFEDHADDLEYFYAVESDDIDPDGKVFVKARAEMKDKYAEWRKEFEELKPENNDYEEYARSNFKEELLHNPLATIAWYELMARHSVFTQNNPWIKENLEAMHKAYKLDPKVAETVGTATFLTFSEEHKEDEEECDYTHIISNDEMWEYMCYGARMFELTERTGFKQLNSKVRWGLEIDDDYPDLTKPLLLDKKEDQTSGYFDAYSVKVDGKVVVYFGMHCSDNGLAEFDLAAPKKTTTTTQKKKEDPTYSLTVYYREQNTTKDLITPVPIGRFAAGHPYGPFTIVKIENYTAITTSEQTKGTMPAADHAVVIWYKKNAAPSNDNGNPGGGDPGSKPDPEPGKPKPKPEGDKPKDEGDSTNGKPGSDQPSGTNDDKKGESDKDSDPTGTGNQQNKDDNTQQQPSGGDSDQPDKGKSDTATEDKDDGDQKTSTPSDTKKDGVVGGF